MARRVMLGLGAGIPRDTASTSAICCAALISRLQKRFDASSCTVPTIAVTQDALEPFTVTTLTVTQPRTMALHDSQFSDLPAEIIQNILVLSPPKTAQTLLRTSKRLNEFASQPLLWRHHCLSEYRYWDMSTRLMLQVQTPVANVDWKEKFAKRRRSDSVIRRLLEHTINQPSKLPAIKSIVGLGFDAKDELLRQFNVDPNAEDYLARTFWADACLGTIHREKAITEWGDMTAGEQDSLLERVLGAFDVFVHEGEGGSDFDDISRMLDGLADEFRNQYPQLNEMTTRQKALTLATFLRAQGYKGVSDDRYNEMATSFLGFALRDPEHEALPPIQVAIYCCVAQRLDITAVPCGFPLHVHGVVFAPEGLTLDGKPNRPSGRDKMYVDPFRDDKEVPISSLTAVLGNMGVTASAHQYFLGPASVSKLVMRTSRNIMRSVEQQLYLRDLHNAAGIGIGVPMTNPDHNLALYASFWVSILLTDQVNLPSETMSNITQRRRFLPPFVEKMQLHYPWDVDLFEEYVLPIFHHMDEGEQLHAIMVSIRADDATPKNPLRRNERAENVKFKVGQLFTHKRYGYEGVVVGWDVECDADEDWMVQMGVDRLDEGRNQGFYHVVVADRTQRYVAQENIVPNTTTPSSAILKIAGRYFRRWDDESKMFISNIKNEYPDD